MLQKMPNASHYKQHMRTVTITNSRLQGNMQRKMVHRTNERFDVVVVKI
jgi:hypothetical protein